MSKKRNLSEFASHWHGIASFARQQRLQSIQRRRQSLSSSSSSLSGSTSPSVSIDRDESFRQSNDSSPAWSDTSSSSFSNDSSSSYETAGAAASDRLEDDGTSRDGPHPSHNKRQRIIRGAVAAQTAGEFRPEEKDPGSSGVETRVGSPFQAEIANWMPPVAVAGSNLAYSSFCHAGEFQHEEPMIKSMGDVLWHPELAEHCVENGDAVVQFIRADSPSLQVSMQRMEALHIQQYNVERAGMSIVAEQLDDVANDAGAPWDLSPLTTAQMRTAKMLFQAKAKGELKGFPEVAARELNMSVSTVLVHYYRWKGEFKSRKPYKYQEWKNMRNPVPTQCRVCDKTGALLVCGHCRSGYHGACHNPPHPRRPLDQPWYCSKCIHSSPAQLRRLTPASPPQKVGHTDNGHRAPPNVAPHHSLMNGSRMANSVAPKPTNNGINGGMNFVFAGTAGIQNAYATLSPGTGAPDTTGGQTGKTPSNVTGKAATIRSESAQERQNVALEPAILEARPSGALPSDSKRTNLPEPPAAPRNAIVTASLISSAADAPSQHHGTGSLILNTPERRKALLACHKDLVFVSRPSPIAPQGSSYHASASGEPRSQIDKSGGEGAATGVAGRSVDAAPRGADDPATNDARATQRTPTGFVNHTQTAMVPPMQIVAMNNSTAGAVKQTWSSNGAQVQPQWSVSVWSRQGSVPAAVKQRWSGVGGYRTSYAPAATSFQDTTTTFAGKAARTAMGDQATTGSAGAADQGKRDSDVENRPLASAVLGSESLRTSSTIKLATGASGGACEPQGTSDTRPLSKESRQAADESPAPMEWPESVAAINDSTVLAEARPLSKESKQVSDVLPTSAVAGSTEDDPIIGMYWVHVPVVDGRLLFLVHPSPYGGVAFAGYVRTPNNTTGPSERMGLFRNVGDIIVSVDNRNVQGMDYSDVLNLLKENAGKLLRTICMTDVKYLSGP